MATIDEYDKGLLTSKNRLLYLNEYKGYFTLCMVERGNNDVIYMQKCWPVEWKNSKQVPLMKDAKYQKAQPMVLKATLGTKEEAIEFLEQALGMLKAKPQEPPDSSIPF